MPLGGMLKLQFDCYMKTLLSYIIKDPGNLPFCYSVEICGKKVVFFFSLFIAMASSSSSKGKITIIGRLVKIFCLNSKECIWFRDGSLDF